MAQLTAIRLLEAQDPDQQASLAIAAVAIIDGAVPDYDLLKTILAERIQAIPRCTQVLRTHPADAAREWIDYPGFDLTQHVRRVRFPGRATTPNCSGPSPMRWSVRSTWTARCGSAGSSRA